MVTKRLVKWIESFVLGEAENRNASDREDETSAAQHENANAAKNERHAAGERQ